MKNANRNLAMALPVTGVWSFSKSGLLIDLKEPVYFLGRSVRTAILGSDEVRG